MQKSLGRIYDILGKILIIGCSVQMLLGILWLGCNFGTLQEFGESSYLVQVSKSFLCDEDTGILYPVLVMLARGVEKLIHIPFYCVLYLLQLLLGLYAGHRFLQTVRKSGRLVNLWGSLVLLTIPFVLQCHLAVLPYSLAGSFGLLELAFAIEAVRKGTLLEARELIKVTAFWLLEGLLLPEYLYLGAIPVLILLAYSFFQRNLQARKKVQQICHNLVLVAAFAGILVAVGDLTQVPGSEGGVNRSVSFCAASRFAWTSLTRFYDGWPEEARTAVDEGELLESSFYADNMARILAPQVEETLGEEGARQFYWYLVKAAWLNNRAALTHEIVWDAAAYTVSPLAFTMQLTGRGYDSYSGRNYEIMRQKAPLLTRYYVNYGCWWFGVMVGWMAVMVFLRLAETVTGLYLSKKRALEGGNKARLQPGKVILSVVLCAMTAVGMVLWYTFQGAGMMDYKNVVLINLLWTAGALALAEGPNVSTEC